MAARLPLKVPFKGPSCLACQASVLRSFISTSAPLVSVRASSHAFPTRPTAIASRFSSTSSSTPASQDSSETASTGDYPDTKTSDEAAGPPEETGSDIPWYLQEEAPRHPTLVHEPTKVPDLPHDPPRLLEPLLQFAADDLGLDDLKLFDLRTLDPPPALGPNLIMLFGTARSERHLHVSAGSLVRWLRARGIKADADGLLGPNELKIRLRRKARKAKLMGGSGLAPSQDDGISTRWICVNLGTLGWTSAETEVQSDDGRFSGFGTPQVGTTIVVQMFTEAKRKELDLETLWSRILQRSEDRQKDDSMPRHEDRLYAAGRGARGLSTPAQQRSFSTSTRLKATVADLETSVAHDSLAQEAPESVPSGGVWPDVDTALIARPKEKLYLLAKLKRLLKTLSSSESQRAMNRRDSLLITETSTFMDLWTAALVDLPGSQAWSFRCWLYARGRKVHHPDYTLSGVQDLVKELLLSGYQASRKDYMFLIRSIYRESEGNEEPLGLRSEIALDLLDTMFERGERVLSNDVIVSILQSLGRSVETSPEADQLQSAMERLMVQAKLPYMGEYWLSALLDTYATQGKWDKFWETWRIPPRYQQRRSPNMYVSMYNRMAKIGHQSQCIDTVRWCFQEMMNEDPPIPLKGEVREALLACIRVADPEAEALIEKFSGTNLVDVTDRRSRNEFVKLWYIIVNQDKLQQPLSGRE